jgi:CRP/FNR family cyclic AMP-dependent transcriptional regulator
VAATADRLKQVPLFAELSDKELRGLADLMTERTFPAGSTVTEEGSGGAGFFVIDDGTAEVSVAGEERGTLGPGDHFGEVALIAKMPRTATIVATTDLRCYGLTQWQFRPLVEGDAKLAWKLLEGLARTLSR